MDWDALEQRKVRPPFRPRVVSSQKALETKRKSSKFSLSSVLEKRTRRRKFRHGIHTRRASVDARSQRHRTLHQSRRILGLFLCQQRIRSGTKDLLLKPSSSELLGVKNFLSVSFSLSLSPAHLQLCYVKHNKISMEIRSVISFKAGKGNKERRSKEKCLRSMSFKHPRPPRATDDVDESLSHQSD